MQERAEVQNVIVLQHWSLEEVKSLYGVANDEAQHDTISPSHEDPPPSYDAPNKHDIRLQVTEVPKNEEQSQALVSYREQPLQELDASLHRALALENHTLDAQVPDIVNHLLHEWIQLAEPKHTGQRSIMSKRPQTTRTDGHKYRPHYSSEEETTESEYERSDGSRRGYYLEGPRRSTKNVRFKAKVEDDTDEDEHRPRRLTKRHILRSEDEDSSDSESQMSPVAHWSNGHGRERRDSDPKYDSSPRQSSERMPRPYAGARNYPPEEVNNRPGSSRGAPQPHPPQSAPPQHPTPVQTTSYPQQYPQQQWPNQPPSAGLRPPQYGLPPMGPQRMPSNGQYIPQQYMGASPQASPQPPPGSYFPRPNMPLGQGPPSNMQTQPPRRTPPSRNRSHRSESKFHEKQVEKAEKDKKSASRNLKTGLGIGAAAAGLMELLSGLDGI